MADRQGLTVAARYAACLLLFWTALSVMKQSAAGQPAGLQKPDAMLANGLEVFEFGMTPEQVNDLLPLRIQGLNWDKLIKNTSYKNVDERFFGEHLRLFGTPKWLWVFRREYPIFILGPCISTENEWIYFHFINNALFRIRLAAVDGADCRSHEPLVKAVADFYGLKTDITSYVGVGIGTNGADGVFRISRVQPHGPADRAGVEIGDMIKAVDGTDIAHMTLDDVTAKIRGAGALGSAVVLDVWRETEKRLVHVRMNRETLDQSATFKFVGSRVCLIGAWANGKGVTDIIRTGATDGSADGCQRTSEAPAETQKQ